MENKKKSGFSGKLGFILAAAGSAVGLGNIWRFPYLASKYGGGIFLFTYVVLSVTFGFSLMIAEIAIGRRTGKNALEAFGNIDKRYSFIGKIAVIGPLIVLPYYSVIGGWVVKYFFAYLTGSGNDTLQSGYFDTFVSSTGEPIVWLCVFAAVTVLIVMMGVEKGTERVSKITMPILAALSVFIAIYVATIDGAFAGIIYYITPDFSKLSPMTVVAAVGQLFYSMTLAMGVMITYGSYMKKDVSLEKSVHIIEFFDTGMAFLAGLMVIPAVFAFSGGAEEALGQGPALMFVTLPKVFGSMAGGQIMGTLFFLLVFFAALTSSVSMTEAIVSVLEDKLKIGRQRLCLIVLLFVVLVGTPSSLGYGVWSGIKIFGLGFLDFFDFLGNSLLMPTVAFFTCVFLGFVVKPSFVTEEIELNGRFKMKGLFGVMIKYIAPAFLVAIIVFSALDVFDIIII